MINRKHRKMPLAARIACARQRESSVTRPHATQLTCAGQLTWCAWLRKSLDRLQSIQPLQSASLEKLHQLSSQLERRIAVKHVAGLATDKMQHHRKLLLLLKLALCALLRDLLRCLGMEGESRAQPDPPPCRGPRCPCPRREPQCLPPSHPP